MTKNLLIVESPAKAKTIEKILGKDFTVKSSYGHIRDLSKKEDGVDVNNKFKPKYVISKDKQKIVKELKDWVKKSDVIWLATDEDREGEAISWHLCEVLGLDKETTNRIVFREITKPAISGAIQNPRTIDLHLVDAQQARRILDRLVGFELSGLLWKKVKGKLSAGRVQSVAVKLIVDQERDIQNFNPVPYFNLSGLFKGKDKAGKTYNLKAEVPSRFQDLAEMEVFLKQCVGALYSISKVQVKPAKRTPAAPFTTSTLQQEASRKLGFSVSRTMLVAQRLYEAGHISYMRTDSTNLSEVAIQNIANMVEKTYGKEYVNSRRYKNKKGNSQEAHEAIRPTYFEKVNVTNDYDQQRLYELIWKRTIASQMADALIEKTVVDIAISTIDYANFVATGQILKFDGFLKVYLESTDEDQEEDEDKAMLPPLTVGEAIDAVEITATERFTRKPARFTEASLVKKLEELGIGRPSTYAPTISKITEQSRGYIVKESREGVARNYIVFKLADGKITQKVKEEITGTEKNKLFPTDLGMIVSDFLSQHFSEVMDYGFTADIEKQFDDIAAGKKEWSNMLNDFYTDFHEDVEETLENAERATGERILGKDPESGRTLLVRWSRFGPVAQIGKAEELDEDEKPKYSNLKPFQSLETIKLEDALELFELPKILGEYEKLEVLVAEGRYGPYIKFDGQYIALPKGEDPLAVDLERGIEIILEKRKEDAPIAHFDDLPITKGSGRFGPFVKWNGLFVSLKKTDTLETITAERAIELVEAKKIAEANKYIAQWDEEKIAIMNGRWGPYIKFGKRNFKIPKDKDPKELTLEDCKAIIGDTGNAAKSKSKAKTKAKPKAKAKTKAKPKKKKEE